MKIRTVLTSNFGRRAYMKSRERQESFEFVRYCEPRNIEKKFFSLPRDQPSQRKKTIRREHSYAESATLMSALYWTRRKRRIELKGYRSSLTYLLLLKQNELIVLNGNARIRLVGEFLPKWKTFETIIFM